LAGALLIMSGLVVLDQATKFLVVTNLSYGQSIPILFNLLSITYVHNFGAAFGLFAGHRLVFVVAVLVTLAILFIWRKDLARSGPKALYSCGLLMGGALGNLVDRLRLGYVIDFIDLGWWPVFNIADCGIVLGAISLALITLKAEIQ